MVYNEKVLCKCVNVVENTMANTVNKTNVQTSDFNNFQLPGVCL